MAGVPLDALASQTLRLIALAFLRCGFSRRQLTAAFNSFVANAPRSLRPAERGTRLDLHDPAHVITLWSTDPEYVDAHGMPRALPVRGANVSIETLVKRVSSTLQVDEALDQLVRTGTVRKIGRLYIPGAEFVLHRRGTKTQSAHHLRILNALVRNFEFNAKLKPGDLSWPQRVAECPDFPADELDAFIKAFDKRTIRVLDAEDKTMARIAHSARKAAPRVRPTINYFLSLVDTSRAPTTTSSRSRRGALQKGETPGHLDKQVSPRRRERSRSRRSA